MATRKRTSSSKPMPLAGVTIIAVTEKAVLLEWKEHDEVMEAWVPRSVCEDGASLSKEDKDVSVAAWFVEQEGLPT